MKVWSENNRRTEALAAQNARALKAAKEAEGGFEDADTKTRNKIGAGLASMLLINEIEELYANMDSANKGRTIPNALKNTGFIGGILNSITPMRTDKDAIDLKLTELGQQLVLIKSGVVARADERQIEELKLPSTLSNFDTQLQELDDVKTNMKHQIDSVYFILSDRDKRHFLKTMGPSYQAPKIPDLTKVKSSKTKQAERKQRDADQIEALKKAIEERRKPNSVDAKMGQ